MNKNFDKRIVRRKKIFENIKVGKKDTGIKRKFNSSNYTVKKNYKLMKGVSYGNDINYQRYMAYLDKIREGEELDINKLLSKKISFSEFVNKYKINPYIMQYFDYFDIQKINRKEIERNLKSANNKKPIKIPSEYNEDSSELIEDEKNKN